MQLHMYEYVCMLTASEYLLIDQYRTIRLQFKGLCGRALSYEPILFWWRTTTGWMPVL